MHPIRATALLITAALALAGCASVEFIPVKADQTVYEGRGGAVKQIDGIDFWFSGEPNTKYEVLGIIQGSSEDGESFIRSAVARLAKEKGAQGVILKSKDSQNTGISRIGSYSYIESEDREEYWLVRYLR